MKRIIAVALLFLVATAALADPVKFFGSVRLRAESWSFFETPGFDDGYTFGAALLRASAAQQVNPNLDCSGTPAAARSKTKASVSPAAPPTATTTSPAAETSSARSSPMTRPGCSMWR